MAEAATEMADKVEVVRPAESMVQEQAAEMKLMADMFAERGGSS